MSNRLKVIVVSMVIAASVAWFGRSIWLTVVGQYLIGTTGELNSMVDVVVVPAADYIRPDVTADTLEEAGRMIREQRAGHILMICPEFYGFSECELAGRLLRDRGYTGVQIEALRTERVTDEMEANLAISHLSSVGEKSAVVLLPNYKVRRLGSAYRKLASRSGVTIVIRGHPTEFDPHKWWNSREGQKRFAEELLRRIGVV